MYTKFLQNIAERPHNITSIVKNPKSLTKPVYQKKCAQNIKKKQDQNNYFRAEKSQKQEKVLRLKEKRRLTFNKTKTLLFF